MAGFDPNQPRDEEGKWTEVENAARHAAGLGSSIQQIVDSTQIGDEFVELGKISVIAYRTGSIDHGHERGIFFGNTPEAIKDYESLHANEPVKEYQITTGNTIAAKDVRSLYQQLYKKRLDLNAIDDAHKFNSPAKALRWAEARVARTLTARGFDSAILSAPFNAPPELWIFPKNKSTIRKVG